MQGLQDAERVLFDSIDLQNMIPENHLLRRIDKQDLRPASGMSSCVLIYPVPGELLLKRLLVTDITRDKESSSGSYSDQHDE